MKLVSKTTWSLASAGENEPIGAQPGTAKYHDLSL